MAEAHRTPLDLTKVPRECPVHKSSHTTWTVERVDYTCGCRFTWGWSTGERWLFGQMVHLVPDGLIADYSEEIH